MKSKVDDADMVDVKVHQEKLELYNLIRIIDEAKAKYVPGRSRPFKEFIKEFKDERKIYD